MEKRITPENDPKLKLIWENYLKRLEELRKEVGMELDEEKRDIEIRIL
jgi:hypothetical protein